MLLGDQLVESDPENPWSVPDWRKVQRYPDADSTTIAEWRWEFIRRSPRYRQLWSEFEAASLSEAHAEASGRFDEIALRLGLKYMLHPGRVRPIFDAFLGGQSGVVMPAFYVDDEVNDFISAAEERGRYLVSIDPCAPLDEQVARMREEIDGWRSELGQKPSSERWPRKAVKLYLRMLDAREHDPSKPTWESITATLNNEKEYRTREMRSFRRCYEEALDLRAALVDRVLDK